LNNTDYIEGHPQEVIYKP